MLNIEYKHVSILSGFTKSFIVNDAYKTSAFIFVDAMILLGHHSLKDEITNWPNLFFSCCFYFFIIWRECSWACTTLNLPCETNLFYVYQITHHKFFFTFNILYIMFFMNQQVKWHTELSRSQVMEQNQLRWWPQMPSSQELR